MAFARKALFLFLVAAFCIQLSTGESKSGSLQLRCQCIKYSSKPSPWSRILEFSVTRPHSRCKTTEVVITLKTINPATRKNYQRCLDLTLTQTAILQECWNSVNKDESKPVLKFSECGLRK